MIIYVITPDSSVIKRVWQEFDWKAYGGDYLSY